MKIKKVARKLSLKKETISNLNSAEMDVIKGGTTSDTTVSVSCSCPPPTYQCPSETVCNTHVYPCTGTIRIPYE